MASTSSDVMTCAQSDERLEQALVLLTRGLSGPVESVAGAVSTHGEAKQDAVMFLETITTRWWEFGDLFRAARPALVGLLEALSSSHPVAAGQTDALLRQMEQVLDCVAPREAEAVAKLRGAGAEALAPTTHASSAQQQAPPAFEQPKTRSESSPPLASDHTAARGPGILALLLEFLVVVVVMTMIGSSTQHQETAKYVLIFYIIARCSWLNGKRIAAERQQPFPTRPGLVIIFVLFVLGAFIWPLVFK